MGVDANRVVGCGPKNKRNPPAGSHQTSELAHRAKLIKDAGQVGDYIDCAVIEEVLTLLLERVPMRKPDGRVLEANGEVIFQVTGAEARYHPGAAVSRLVGASNVGGATGIPVDVNALLPQTHAVDQRPVVTWLWLHNHFVGLRIEGLRQVIQVSNSAPSMNIDHELTRLSDSLSAFTDRAWSVEHLAVEPQVECECALRSIVFLAHLCLPSSRRHLIPTTRKLLVTFLHKSYAKLDGATAAASAVSLIYSGEDRAVVNVLAASQFAATDNPGAPAVPSVQTSSTNVLPPHDATNSDSRALETAWCRDDSQLPRGIGDCPFAGCSRKVPWNGSSGQVVHLNTHVDLGSAPYAAWVKILGNPYKVCVTCSRFYTSVKTGRVSCTNCTSRGTVPSTLATLASGPTHLEEVEEEGGVDWVPPIPYDVLCRLQLPLLDSLPYGARPACAASFHSSLQGSGTKMWWRVFVFSKLVLSSPQVSRGGGHARVKEIIRRCILFSSGQYQALFDCAVKRSLVPRTEHEGPERQEKFPVIEDELEFPGAGHTAAEAEDIREVTLARVNRLVNKGQFSRASTALECADLAAQTEASKNALQLLHPTSDWEAPPLDANTPWVEDPTPEALIRVLRQFPKGAAGGCSGLTPGILLELVSQPGTLLAPDIARIMGLIMNGKVPASAAPYWYGARLIALVKDLATLVLRPIGCGEALRRMSSRYLNLITKDDAALYLQPRGHLAVGVPHGVEGINHALRLESEMIMSQRTDPEVGRLICLQVDLKNCHNCIARSVFTEQVKLKLPRLLRYTHAAYGRETLLYFGEHVIKSQCGGHQGDSPVTTYAGLTIEKFSEDHLQNFVFRFRAWFSDDGTFIGPPAQIAELISQLETHGPAYGLFINFGKCKLISVHGGPIAEIPQITRFGSFSDWTSLGVQVGDAAARARDISRVVAKASTKNRRFAAMSGDSHNALTLLRYCGSFNLICFHMRAMGPSPEWATYDLNVRGCVEHVITGLTSIAWDQVQLPLRDGGCGITSASAHAASACIASILESQALRSCLTQTPFPYDSLLEFCLKDPTLHTFSQAKAYATAQTRVEKLDKNLQKKISTLVSNEQRRKLVASLEVAAASDSGRGLARLASAAHTGASLYLVRPSSVSGILHIQSDKFRALMCMRLGQPLSLEDLPCQLCFKKKADVLGDHVCTCMTSGVRNLAHNELRNTFTALAYTAFMMPKMEVHPFPQAPSLRLDTALRSGFKGKTALLDFAITHSLKPSSLAPSKPGNAANDYVHVKEAMYGGYINENLHLFVPMVIDTFGCWCDRARPILGAVAHSYAKRTGTGRLGVLHVFATLNACIMNSVGSILLAGHATVKNRTYRTLPRGLRVADSESSDTYNSAGEEDERPSTGTESSSEDDDDDDERINGVTQEEEDNQTFSSSVANPPAYGSASFTASSSIPASFSGSKDASATHAATASSSNPAFADASLEVLSSDN